MGREKEIERGGGGGMGKGRYQAKDSQDLCLTDPPSPWASW